MHSLAMTAADMQSSAAVKGTDANATAEERLVNRSREMAVETVHTRVWRLGVTGVTPRNGCDV